jgi:hypothetical protein
MPVKQDIWDSINPEPNTGCWLWSGAHSKSGYGTVRHPVTRKVGNSHRIVYEMECGPIPDGKDLDHLCRNPACVNPDHLEPVSRAENVNRGVSPELSRQRWLGNTLRRYA